MKVSKLRFILDTNVIIPLEDSSILLEEPLQFFIKSAGVKGYKLLYHPATKTDIKRDKNVIRRERSLAALCKYSELESHNVTKDELINDWGDVSSPNDLCDNFILHSIYRNCADFLVTEDLGIHKKARNLRLSERVLYIQQASNLLRDNFKEENLKFPGILELFLTELNLDMPVFESLSASYGGFESWFEKSQREGRKCWVINESGEIDALAILKDEDSPIITIDDKGLREKTLKICTFKVAPLSRGKHYGELLLKKTFITAFEQDYKNIYLTIREGEQPHLRELLETNGFFSFGKTLTNDGFLDDVYVKSMYPAENSFNEPTLYFSIKYHPHFLISEDTGFFCIPIQPRYHRHLFPEVQIQQELLGSGAIVGNSIRQAYICSSNSNQVTEGSIIFFYRSKDYKQITTFGIVEKVERTNDPTRAIQLTRKRTIYSDEDIKNTCLKGALIILFRVLGHFDKPISREALHELGIKGNTQSIRRLERKPALEILDTNDKRNYFTTS